MKKNGLFYFFSLFLIFVSPLLFPEGSEGAISQGVEVSLTSTPTIESLPGKTVSGNYLIVNHTESEKTLLEEIILPEGWTFIAHEEGIFSLDPNQKEIRIFAFLIPPNTPPGLNDVKITIKNTQDSSVIAEKRFPVTVLPLYELHLRLEERPEKVVAGLTYTLKARAFNNGNLNVKVRLTARIHPESTLKIEPSSILDIEPGGSRSFSIHIETDGKIIKKTYQAVNLAASIEEIPSKVSSEQSFSIEIVPRMVGKEDPYHRVQSTLTLKGIYENRNRDDSRRPFGGQIEFQGAGTLDEEGEKKVVFRFRGPESKTGIYLNKDEYMLSYTANSLSLHLGDGYYSLSPLLNLSNSHRGLKVKYELDRISAKAFFAVPREKNKNDYGLGGTLGYRFSDSIRTAFHFKRNELENNGYHNLGSFWGTFGLERKVRLELEGGIAVSKEEERFKDYAWRVHLWGEPFQGLRYSFLNYHIGSEFLGSLPQGNYTTGNLSIPIYKKISGNLSLSKYRENISSKVVANRTTESNDLSLQAGFSWEMSNRVNLNLTYRLFDRRDSLIPKDYDFRDQTGRIGFYYKDYTLSGKNGSIGGYIELGQTEDRLSDKEKIIVTFGLSGNFTPSPKQNYSFFMNYGKDYYSKDNFSTLNLGITGRWKPAKNLSFDLSYYLNQRDFEQETYFRHNFRSKATYLFPNYHSIHLGTEFIATKNGDRSEFSVNLGYTIPLSIPVTKKKSVGMIKGVVYDEEDMGKSPLKDVILFASGIPAVTDKTGKFVFPGLKPGEYFLQIEKGPIGHDRTPSEKLEPIIVKGGELSTIHIGISRSGKISGKVELFTPKKGFIIDETLSSEDFVPYGGLSGALIEIRRKNEVLRQFSDARGEFVFEDVRPGLWLVKIYEESLPPFHSLKEREFEIEVKPAEEKTIKIDVFRKPRRILIIDEERRN